MTLPQYRRFAYLTSAVLGAGYAVYVVVLKSMQLVVGGPLGELGEFLLVLAAVTAFVVGLFIDEAMRGPTEH